MSTDRKRYTHVALEQLQLTLLCKYCDTAEWLIEDMHLGETVCKGCGLVVAPAAFSMEAEWRSFDDDPYDKSRVGYAKDTNFHTYIPKTYGFEQLYKAHCASVKATQDLLKEETCNLAENVFERHFFSVPERRAINHMLSSLKTTDIPRMHGFDSSMYLRP